MIKNPELRIDKDGYWFADGSLMHREGILSAFAAHLKKEEPDKYSIDWQGQSLPVSVEEAPFFCRSFYQAEGSVFLLLRDGREVPAVSGKIIMKREIPYLSLFWEGDTKLSRSAFETLCACLSETEAGYVVRYGNCKWLITEDFGCL